MRCYEVLGIEGNATKNEILEAYIEKRSSLEKSQSILSPTAYEQKLAELESAQTDCLAWAEKSSFEKFGARIQGVEHGSNNQIRLYSSGICIGPCTCLDACFYCDNTGTSTFCISTVGSQTIPIICDVLLWIAAISGIVGGVGPSLSQKGKQKKAEKEAAREAIARAKRREAADRAIEENRALRQQLESCEETIAKIQQEIYKSQEHGVEFEAFGDMFSAMGISGDQAISQNEKEKVRNLQMQLDGYNKQAAELRKKIADNQSIISAV